MKAIPTNPKGFTLVELLVAMAAGSVVMIAIYAAYINHSRSHVTQQLVVEMQQNARAAMSLIKREVRMMGYDPVASDGVDNDATGGIDDETSGAGIVEAEYQNASGISTIRFTADHSYDGATDDEHEDVVYTLVGTQLQRNGQIVAYDIEALGFAYAFDVDTDDDEELDQSAGGNIIWAIDKNTGDTKLDAFLDTNDDGIIDENDTEGGSNMATQIDIGFIRAVRIWLLARTRHPIPGHTDNNTYVVGANHRGPADGDWDPRRKRVLLTTTIYCRNMGI
jgi:type IV pilus assembly protein PilW